MYRAPMKRTELLVIYYGLAVVAGAALAVDPGFSSPWFWTGVVLSGAAIFVRSRWLDLHGLTRETIVWIALAAFVLVGTTFLTRAIH